MGTPNNTIEQEAAEPRNADVDAVSRLAELISTSDDGKVVLTLDEASALLKVSTKALPAAS